MSPTNDPRTRLGAVAFLLAGALFLLYPAVRPWHDETTVDGATEAMTAGNWVASHLFAMLGFILVALGVLALYGVTRQTRAEPVALSAVLLTWVGVGLTLPYYGAETYGLHAIADASAAGQAADLLGMIDAVRYQPVAATTFALGLAALAAGAVLAAVAVWRSELLPRTPAVLVALGFLLFFPQFFTPAAVRIGHGVLLASGLAWLAWTMWRGPRARSAR